MAPMAVPDGRSPRVARLLASMTTEQKAAQLGSVWVMASDAGGLGPYRGTFSTSEPPPLEPQLRDGIGELTRPFGSAPVEAAEGLRGLRRLQAELGALGPGLPALVHEECLAGLMAHGATAFPCPLNWGSTWDPDLIRDMAGAIREQMRFLGVHQGLAPLLDVVRDARWGRVEECISEDPYLVGTIGCAYIEGLQGADPGRGVIATAKHFAGYSTSAGGRNLGPAQVGPREMADVLLLPFEMSVSHAGLRSIMNAYQEIDGEPVAASRHLLTRVLREEWGFDGLVVSDYFSIAMLHTDHGVAADRAEAAALALKAGVDVELPGTDCYGQPLLDALGRGLVTEADLDRATARVLRAKEESGLLDGLAVPEVPPTALDLDSPADRALARRVAERSLVLLQNEDELLPLRPSARVALVGPTCASARALLGNYSFQNHTAAHFPEAPEGVSVPTVADALGDRLGAGRLEVVETGEVTRLDPQALLRALEACRQADVAVVVVGDQAGHFGAGTSGEGTDTDDLSLPGQQLGLVESVAATGTPTVVVLVCGRPYDLESLREQARAVVVAWFPGEEGGTALADLLVGAIEPSGRAPVSFYRGAGQQPLHYDSKRLSLKGYGARTTRPVFAFGHGLSYTTFEYSSFEAADVPSAGELQAAVVVTNCGRRRGSEVVQLYTRQLVGSVTRPVMELKAYGRVELDVGRSARVSFRVPSDLLAFTGADMVRSVEPGGLEVMIGASSADIRHRRRVEIRGARRVAPSPRRLLSRTVVEPV